MKIAITCDNELEFNFAQKITLEANYKWRGSNIAIKYPYLEIVKIVLYLDDSDNDKLIYYGRFSNYDDHEEYKLYLLNKYDDYMNLIQILNVNFDYDYNKINNYIDNLYKPRKRKIEESINILKFNQFNK